jgi:broad specificity phosphatase PhoE
MSGNVAESQQSCLWRRSPVRVARAARVTSVVAVEGRARPARATAKVPLVPIYLVRHAHAGSRGSWHGDDDLRPLSAQGRRQTEHLLSLLADEPVGRLFSSPTRRCTETLEPLARRMGRPIETADELAEDADPEEAERFLLAHAPENPVACSHGDLIPRVLHRLHAAGMRASADTIAPKGSMWMLAVDDGGAVVTGTYHAPAD